MSYADQRADVDEWYYFPDMRRGEAVVFKQFDTVAELPSSPPPPPEAADGAEAGRQVGHAAAAAEDDEEAERAACAAATAEALVAPGPDPDSVRAAFTLHTSFREARARRKPPRRSIEYRVLVFEDAEATLPDDFGRAAMDAIAQTAAEAAAKRGGATETTGMRADAA